VSSARSDSGGTVFISSVWTQITTGSLQNVLAHIRGEFLESPGLRLTAWQIQRLWHLAPSDCDVAVQALIDARFLREERDGTFARDARA
jgi:hypothetical protein